MHKRLLGAALAASTLLAGQQASQSVGTPQTPNLQQAHKLAERLESSGVQAQKPAPVEPTDSLAKYLEELAFQPSPALDFPVRFVERPGHHKVKYGKRRWVILS